jgi:hypothetical protein
MSRLAELVWVIGCDAPSLTSTELPRQISATLGELAARDVMIPSWIEWVAHCRSCSGDCRFLRAMPSLVPPRLVFWEGSSG